jgi:hypothetical protein
LWPGVVVVWSNEVVAHDSVRVGNSVEQVAGVAQGAMPRPGRERAVGGEELQVTEGTTEAPWTRR